MEKYNLKLDYYGLLNLHKALLEAKFHTMPDNKMISGSPLIANIYIQIRDLLLDSVYARRRECDRMEAS